MDTSSIFMLLVTLSPVLCDINNNFNSVPTTVKTFENDTVLLPCYHNTPYKYVKWIQEDTIIVDSRHPEIQPPSPRIHLFSNGSLQVSRVQLADTGEYTCEIVTTGGIATQLHAIEVQYSPTVLSKPRGTIELPNGTFFEMSCDAKGVPYPIITWRHNGVPTSDVLESTRQFYLEITNKDQSGTIECVASNGVGEPAVDGINLIVLFKPEVSPFTSVVHSKIGLRAHLECYVSSAPIATVHWFHNGVPIVSNSKTSRLDTDLNHNKTVFHYHSKTKHMLIIKKVRDGDFGTYECMAENKIGYSRSSIELTGRAMPSVFKTSPLAPTPLTYNLIWQTESVSPITEYKLKFRQIPTGNVTPQNRQPPIDWNELTIPAEYSDGPIHTIGYTLHGLVPASVYEVAVTAKNRYGWSDISRVVRFGTSGEIEIPNYATETIEYDHIDDNYIADIDAGVHYDYSSNAVMKSFYSMILILTLLLIRI